MTRVYAGQFPGAEQARCALPEYAHVSFFPERPMRADRREDANYRRDVARAKTVCAACPVREPCLDAALATGGHHDHGIQGGTTPKERIRLRKGHR